AQPRQRWLSLFWVSAVKHAACGPTQLQTQKPKRLTGLDAFLPCLVGKYRTGTPNRDFVHRPDVTEAKRDGNVRIHRGRAEITAGHMPTVSNFEASQR